MHLIKIVACKTLQSFQSVFYAQCSAQQKESVFLAVFLMGTFRDGLCFPRRSPFAGRRFGARKSHENRLRAEVPPQPGDGLQAVKFIAYCFRQLQMQFSMLVH